MYRYIVSIVVSFLLFVPAAWGAKGVRTFVQAGHTIKQFTMTANEKYVITSDEQSIAYWDFKKRKIINIIPIAAREIYYHPINPRYVCVVPYDKFAFRLEYFKVYDLITGKEVERISKSNVPERKSATNDIGLELRDGCIDLFLTQSGKYIGRLDATPATLSSTIDINSDGSQLFVSGLHPAVWNLKELGFSSNIGYFTHLEQTAFANRSLIYKGTQLPPMTSDKEDEMRYGWKQTISGRYESDSTISICGYEGAITQWSTNGTLLNTLKAEGSGPIFSYYESNGKVVAAAYRGIFVGKPGKTLRENRSYSDFMGQYKVVYNMTPPFDGGKYLIACDNDKIVMGDFNDDTYFRKFTDTPSSVMNITLDKTRKWALVAGEARFLCEYNIDNPYKANTYNTNGFRGRMECAQYLPNNIVASGNNKGMVGFWQRGVKDPIKLTELHTAPVIDIKSAPNNNFFCTADTKGSVVVWDAQTLSPIVNLHRLGVNDYIYITPDNYYTGSKGLYDKVHFINNNKVVSFEQYDLSYNRPDIILQRMGGDEQLVRMLHKAWQKRVRRMGFNPDSLSVEQHAPTTKITNERHIPQVTKKESVDLKIKVKDTKYLLSRIMVSVNGVPVGSRWGSDVSSLRKKELDIEKSIELVNGRNYIEVSCINEKGVESYKTYLNVWCEKRAKKPTLYLALVGVSEYKDQAYTLGYAAKDAADFEQLIKAQCGGKFKSIEVKSITNQKANLENIASLNEFYSKAGVDDVAMIFYAGHGVLDSDLNYYLAMHDMDFDNPEQRGWSYDDFESVLDGIKPLAKYCFIDACHSGRIDKEEFVADNTRKVAKGSLVFRGNKGIKALSEENYNINKMIQSLFTDFSRGNGATILSSSNGIEVAIEDGNKANGLFTWAIKQVLTDRSADKDNDGSISMSELAETVSRYVVDLSSGTQTPGMRLENRYIDFSLF